MRRLGLTRRDLFKSLGLGGAAILLTSCGSGQAPAQTPASAAASPAAAKPTAEGQPAKPTAQTESAKPAEKAAAAKEPADLVMAYYGRVDKVELYDTLFKTFTADNPSVRFKGLHMPDQYTQKLSAMFAAGNPPDVAEYESEQYRQFVQQDVLYPLDDLMKRDQGKGFDFDDIFPNPQKVFLYKGKTYGLLETVLPYTIYYNVEMFKQAGLPEPDGNWDFDQFTETARKLIVDANKDGKPEVFGYSPHITESYYCWIWNNGGEYFLENEGRFKSNFSDPKVVEALQILQDFRYKHHISPTVTEAQAFGLANIQEETLFVNKKSATIDEHFIRVMSFRKQKNMFEWNPTGFPVRKGVKRQVYGSTQCRSISKASKSPNASWEWLKFLVGEKATKIYAQVGYWIPPSKKLANSEVFLDPKLPPKNLKYFLDALEYSRPRPAYGRYGEVRQIYYPLLEKIWDNSAKPADIAKDIDEKVNGKLKEWGDLA